MTQSFDDTMQQELQRNASFRKALLAEIAGCMLSGELELGKSMLRKYINGTVGFIKLGKALGKSSKTLMQMLGPKGNPQIRNFFEIVAYLRKAEKISFDVVARRTVKSTAKSVEKKAA